VASAAYVRLILWAYRHKPRGSLRLIAPLFVLSLLGAASIPFAQLLGNGKDLAQLAISSELGPPLLVLGLLLLKPLATVLCLGSGVPGGLFTPSLAFVALLGLALGHLWSMLILGLPPGPFSLLGAAAVPPHGGNGDADRAHHRAPIHLRRPPRRGADRRPAEAGSASSLPRGDGFEGGDGKACTHP